MAIENPAAKVIECSKRAECTPSQLQRRTEQRHENRFRQPAQTQARHRDAQLRRAQIRGQVLQDVPRQPRPAIAPDNQRVQLRIAQFDKGEFRRDKKPIDQNDGQQAEQPEHVGGECIVYNVTSPKITFRMSCKLTMPVSRWSGLKTTAMREPACCIRRKASSRCNSSDRKNGACT